MSESARFTLSAFLGLCRAPFLVLAPICVALGWTSAYMAGASADPLILVLVFAGAVSAHVAVNALNEYQDFQSGLDLQTRRTPFSGGSGTLPANPGLATHAWRLSMGALGFTVLIGLILVILEPAVRVGLMLLGTIGLVIIYTYTRWINLLPWLCLLAPGIGFGLLMVLGTHLVLRGQLDSIAWALALIPFALVNNLLLLNQLPDVDADRSAGRRTLPIVYGKPFALAVYGLFGLFAYCWVVAGWLLGYWPAGGLAALLTLPLLYLVLVGVKSESNRLQRYLGLNVIMVLLTPILLIAGILL